MIAIGYDYGTTTSWMAMLRDLTEVPRLVNMKSSLFIPEYSNERLFGDSALRSQNESGTFIKSPKRFIVRHKQEEFRQKYACVLDDVIQDFTHRVLDQASVRYLQGDDEAYITVTIPNSYDGAQMRFMRESLEKAFLQHYGNVHLSLLPEPIAAALHYAYNTAVPGGNSETCHIVTCDIGGGTTDLSVISLKRSRVTGTKLFDLDFKVIATAYDATLGGDLIDDLLLEFMLNQAECELNDLNDEVEVRSRVTEAKERLSDVKRTSVVFTRGNGQEIESEVNRDNLFDKIYLCNESENQMASVFERLTNLIIKLKNDVTLQYRNKGESDFDWSNIVLLPIGGSMRIPALREMFIRNFKEGRLCHLTTEENGTYDSVVYGALVHSVIMANKETNIRKISIQGRTCMPISIQYLNDKLYQIVQPNMPDGRYTTDCLRPAQIESDGTFRVNDLRFFLRDDNVVEDGDVPDYIVTINQSFMTNGRRADDIPIKVSIDVENSIIKKVTVFISNIDAQGNNFQQDYLITE